MSRPSHSRRFAARALLCGLIATALCLPSALAQNGDSSGQHLRSLAVYEYLGSYKKPTRSRLVPIAIWDGSQFQPGDLYLADPEPLAVESGTLYELMKNGVGVGQVEIMRPEQIASGWVGLGKYLPNPKGSPKLKLPASLTSKAKFASNTPHFAYKPPAKTGVAGGGAKTASSSGGPPRGGSSAEAGRPTLHQSPQAASGPGRATGKTPAQEGRPTLHAPKNAAPKNAAQQNAAPTLHQRNQNQTIAQQLAAPSKSPYPNRPHLSYTHHHTTTVQQAKQETLTGQPPHMHQMPAISDPDGTTNHSYAWNWTSPASKAAARHKLETLARQYLASRTPQPASAPSSKTGAPGLARHPAHKPGTHAGKAAKSAATPQPLALTDEHLHAFELDWGSGPVYVFSARTAAPGQTTTYITLIAKPDFAGGLVPLYKNITPVTLLDYQPRMKLIGAVDATGSGRADLLFNLLTRRSRQFALFRVRGGRAQEVFRTGQQ